MSKDQDARLFFLKIVQSVSMLILWMIVQIGLGMYFEFAYIGSVQPWLNIVFYIQLLITGFWVFQYIRKKWK